MGNCCRPGSSNPIPVPAGPKTFVVIIIGVGEAGKTTLVRQLQLLDNNNPKQTFDDNARTIAKPAVIVNIVRGAYELLEFRKKNKMPVVESSKEAAKELAIFYVRHYDPNLSNISAKKDPVVLPDKVIQALITLANDQDFMSTRHSNADVQIYDGWSYFMKKIASTDGWGTRDWLPDDGDLLHVRHRTNGVVPNSFMFNGQKFEVLDAGGQMAERHKWRQFFANVSGVIWVQSLSDYDQIMFEEKENRFVDALAHWEKTLKDKNMAGKKVVLLLNKYDLLLEKFCNQKIPIDPALGTEQHPVPVFNSKLTPNENAMAVVDWYVDMFRSVPGGKDAIGDYQVMTALKQETVDMVVRAVFIDNYLNVLKQGGLIS